MQSMKLIFLLLVSLFLISLTVRSKNREESIKAAKWGAIAAFIASPAAGLYPFPFLVGPILMFICGLGLIRRSRLAALTALALFLFSSSLHYVENGGAIFPFLLAILFFLGEGLLGTISFHEIEKEENPDYRQIPIDDVLTLAFVNREESIKAAKQGAIAAFIISGVQALLVIFAQVTNKEEGKWGYLNDPFNYLDSVLMVICGLGLIRCSRLAGVTAFVYFLFSRIIVFYSFGIKGGLGLLIPFVALYFLGRGLLGTIKFHKFEKEENPDYKQTPKWKYYLGLLFTILLSFTFLFLAFREEPELIQEYWKNGNLKQEIHLKNGKSEELVTNWYESGERKNELYFKNGKQEGLSTFWHKSGEKKSAGHYKNGKLEGLATSWYESGEKEIESHYKNGKEDGLWTEWDEDGKKSYEEMFKDGQEQ